MFVTMPQFEQTGMSMLAGGGQQYWRAVTASPVNQHWYLFVYEGRVLDARVDLTLLVTWEETLIEVMNLVPEQDRKAVYRVDRRASGGLVFRTVEAIWAPGADEVSAGLPALLAFEGEQGLVDPADHPVQTERERQLLYRASRGCSGKSVAASRRGERN
jgi:hypothetical protein